MIERCRTLSEFFLDLKHVTVRVAVALFHWSSGEETQQEQVVS